MLATVDLASSALKRCVGDVGAIEIPLFSHVSFEGSIDLQHYRLDHSARIASFEPLREKVEMLPVEYRLPNPLPESVLRVRDMRSGEIPRHEDSYWVAIDTFLGGEGALRIGGAPVFVDYIESPAKGFRYFASLGYEGDRKDGFLRGEALFLGEVAHYFFVSPDWTEVQVISQAT